MSHRPTWKSRKRQVNDNVGRGVVSGGDRVSYRGHGFLSRSPSLYQIVSHLTSESLPGSMRKVYIGSNAVDIHGIIIMRLK